MQNKVIRQSFQKVLSKIYATSYLLCISTSERVLRMPFAGWNQFFDAKTTSAYF